MTIEFFKYQGTGNDFIIIDNRQYNLSKNDTKRIRQLCDRKFGIGADGLIFLEDAKDNTAIDFNMVYFNADGNQSSMCGNGGRCIVRFAEYLGIVKDHTTFLAIDGLHEATLTKNSIALKMQDVSTISKHNSSAFILDTGSPHYVTIEKNLEHLDVKLKGASIRYSEDFKDKGINVNFVEPLQDNHFKVRTYERGVEDETLSCGTGVTAVAIAMHNGKLTNDNTVVLDTLGGKLQVSFTSNNAAYTNVWLKGAATQVFKGYIAW